MTLTQVVASVNDVSTVVKVTWIYEGETSADNSHIVQPEIGLLQDTRQ
ncbi:hypothetical protein L2729_17495 [Shewanella gelidimarina]|nr:hypothetical protein [Shewanella gelidimarina]MCL1059768.1 hypothetical protein [Shewanella gelidimarina]